MERLDALSVPLEGGLIEASAGTGKTYTITTLFLRLLVESGLRVGEILVVTFTKAATAELGDRIRARLREALLAFEGNAAGDATLAALVEKSRDRDKARRRIAAAIADFDEAAIFTIHGFCQRVLQAHAFESGESFDAELVADEAAIFEELVEDFWARSLYDASPAWVRRVVEADLVPAKLIALAALGAREPEMAVLPEVRDDAAIDAAAAAFNAARAEAAAIWREEREVIVAELEAAPLNRNKYRVDSLRGWITEMDRLLARERAGAGSLFEKFDRFTTAKLADATKKGQHPPAHRFYAACDRLLEAGNALDAATRDRMLTFQRDLIDFVRREAPRRKEAARVQSFDDLLQRLDRALAGPAGAALAAALRGRYKAALIDEFQDTDPVQYRIFRSIYPAAGAGSLFLIGDPKQAIYSFRGADVFAYLGAAESAKARYTLDTNYRSDPGVVAAVNAIFSRGRDPFLLGGIDFAAVEHAPTAAARMRVGEAAAAPFRVLFVERAAVGAGKDDEPLGKGVIERLLPSLVAADIVRLLGAGVTIAGRPLHPGDVAVLVRKNKQAAAMQEALRALGVPSVRAGDASVFDAPEAEELAHVLGAMIEPGGRTLRRALATSLFGLAAHEIAALERDDMAWDAWMTRFSAWGERLRDRGFMSALRRLLDDEEVPARLLARIDGERRLTNFLHLGEVLHAAAVREHLGPAGLLRWLTSVRRDTRARARLGGEGTELRLESDAAAVKLVTIHKSKGLEYPVVYCPYLWDGALPDSKKARGSLRFHDPEDAHRLKLDLGSGRFDAHLEHARREAAAENLRLAYVALTRAKHQCAVVWANVKDAGASALGYLLHAADEASGDRVEATAKRVAAMRDAEMRAELRALAEASKGAVSVETLAMDRGERFSPALEDGSVLASRVTRPIDSWWRTSSFSGLTRAGRGQEAIEVEGRDRDEEAPARAVAAEAAANTPASEAVEVVLCDFPGGPRAGDLLHKVFELIDFTGSKASIEAVVAQQLQRFGLPEATWAEVVSRAVMDVLATPIGAPGCEALELGRIGSTKRLNELEFMFPAAGSDEERGAGRLITSRTVAEVFARHPAPPVPSEYAAALGRLPFSPFEGFLRGYIDLVFEHEGRFYVADYKSNYLGRLSSDYGAPSLSAAMAEHHYILQYHLYAVAIHRYLGQRIARYDYDTHFGGVFYLFLRGMGPGRGLNAGVFVDRPPKARIEALSGLFAGERRAR